VRDGANAVARIDDAVAVDGSDGIDSHQVHPGLGLYVGRTLLPASHHDMKVRMVNTTTTTTTTRLAWRWSRIVFGR